MKEKLDRVFCSLDWRLMFPEAEAYALPAVGSDHSPLLLMSSAEADPVCDLCREKVETVEHTHLLCPWTEGVWSHPEIHPLWKRSGTSCGKYGRSATTLFFEGLNRMPGKPRKLVPSRLMLMGRWAKDRWKEQWRVSSGILLAAWLMDSRSWLGRNQSFSLKP